MNAADAIRDPGTDDRASTPWLAGRDVETRPGRRASHRASSADVGGAFTSTVVGAVQRVDRTMLWLRNTAASQEHGGEVGLFHELPEALDLTPLVGLSVHATIVSEEGTAEEPTRTLVVTGDDGRVWLIARSGTVQGVRHAISATCPECDVHAALSQRPEGPLAIGTEKLQWLLPVGHSAHLPLRDGSVLRALLVERRDDGTASYVIADPRLFRATLS